MNELALFAGAGGGLLASQLLGATPVCAVEIDEYCARLLRQRQVDGCLPIFPIWSDVRTFDGKPWRGAVDVITGGFPCQDISSAGRRAGLAGESSGLWKAMLRIVGEVRPSWVFAENSPHLRTRGLDRVVEGFAALGYRVAWGVLGASDLGAPHKRRRMWIAAHADDESERAVAVHEALATASAAAVDATHANGSHLRLQPRGGAGSNGTKAPEPGDTLWGSFPDFARMADGMAFRVDRIKATGNGQVPLVAATAWHVLSGCLLSVKGKGDAQT